MKVKLVNRLELQFFEHFVNVGLLAYRPNWALLNICEHQSYHKYFGYNYFDDVD